MKTSQNRIVAYFSGAFEELAKVTWPTKEQAALLTGIVVGVSFFLAVLIGLADLGLSQGYQALLNIVPEQAAPVDSSSPGVISPDDITVETTPVDSSDSSAPTDSTSQQ